jgi:hypothetical protein
MQLVNREMGITVFSTCDNSEMAAGHAARRNAKSYKLCRYPKSVPYICLANAPNVEKVDFDSGAS